MYYFFLTVIHFLSEFNMSAASLTDDQERFLRIAHILLDDVPTHLRAMLKAKFQARFGFAWGDNRATGEFFFANFTARNTPLHISNVIRQGKTEAFDSTALVTCLLFSGILLPRPRRVPRPHPITDSDRVDELRELRNTLAHASSASLTQADFNQKLASLNTIYAQLHWNPTVMRQWAQDPVVTAESVRLQQLLDVERQRYISLDGTVQVLTQSVQGLYATMQALYMSVQGTDRRVEGLTGTMQVLGDTVQETNRRVEDLTGTVQGIGDTVQETDRRVEGLTGTVQGLGETLQATNLRVQDLDEMGQALREDHEQRLQTHSGRGLGIVVFVIFVSTKEHIITL